MSGASPAPQPSESGRLPIQPATTDDPPLGIQLLRYWTIIRRRPWVPIALALLATTLVGIHESRQPPTYQSEGMVQIGMNTGMGLDPGEYVVWAAGRDRVIKTQEKLLTSDEVVEKALISMGEEVPKKGPERRARLQEFLRGISITPIEDTYLVRVEARGSDPEEMTRKVNALMDAFIPFTNEFMVSRYQTQARQLADEIDVVEKKLRGAELKLQDFYDNTGSVQFDERRSSLLEQQRKLEGRLSTLQIEQASLKRDEKMVADGLAEGDPQNLELLLGGLQDETLKARLEQLTRLRARISVLETSHREGHYELRTLRQQLHSQQQSLRQVGRSTLSVLARRLKARETEEHELKLKHRELQEEIIRLDRQAGRHSSLKREVGFHERYLEALRERHSRAESRSQLDMGTTLIVSRAEARELPSQLPTLLVLTFFGSLMLGVGLILGLHFLADTISNEEEARQLHPAILGRVPQLDRKESEQLVLQGTKSQAAEAFRDVRTHLAFAAAGVDRSAILVTSGSPREGKTFVAMNLAAAIVRGGARTLLVDGDMRRPRLQKALHTNYEEGLADVLIGRKQLHEVVRETELEGLAFLPSGPRPPNSSDLLATEAFERFVREALETYDHMVLDSPPADVVSDPSLMARHVTGVVYVVRLHWTRRRAMTRALEQIEAVGGRNLGLVLNGLSRLDQGRYGYGYGYGYRSGY